MCGALREVGDVIERVALLVTAQFAPQVIIDCHDLMSLGRQMHGGGPAEIAIAAEKCKCRMSLILPP